jgi:hypothetical protein
MKDSELNDNKHSTNACYLNFFMNAVLLVLLFTLFNVCVRVCVYTITREWAQHKL